MFPLLVCQDLIYLIPHCILQSLEQGPGAKQRFGLGWGGASLVIQWLRLPAPNAGDPGSIPCQGTRSHMLQLKNPHELKSGAL